MNIARLAVAGVLIPAVFGCGFEPSSLHLINRSKFEMTNIEIVTQQEKIPLGTLPSGKELHFSKHLPGEGAPKIRFAAGGKIWSEEVCYYSSHYPFKGELSYSDTGVVRHCA
jgi:hypothetical protein